MADRAKPRKGDLATRLRCDECGAERIRTGRMYCVCPNGHGRLHPAFTKAAARRHHREKFVEFVVLLPVATRELRRFRGRYVYVIDGHEGEFSLQAGVAKPGRTLEAGDVNAKVLRKGGVVMGRVFRPSKPRTRREERESLGH